jgi:hypothetical protein
MKLKAKESAEQKRYNDVANSGNQCVQKVKRMKIKQKAKRKHT